MIRNFRSIASADVELQPLTVLVGPNGAGKSNLLDVIRFLGDSARLDLTPAVEMRGGYSRVKFRGETKGSVHIEVHANVTQYSSANAVDVYTLEFAERTMRRRPASDVVSPPARFIHRTESFMFKRTQGRGRRVTIRGGDVKVIDVSKSGRENERSSLGLKSDSLGLATLPRLSDDNGGAEIRKVAQLFALFRVFEIDVAAARRPNRVELGPLRDDASNLASFLIGLAQTDVFEDLQSDARALIPGLESIELQVGGGSVDQVSIALAESGLRSLTPLADASYGTVRVLALLALLYDPDPPLLTCVEEIDHGLHPHALDLLVERLREASQKTQFVIATHSPTLVNRLNANELVVCERQANGSSLIPATEASTIREIERAAGGDLRLGELWFSGTLGGILK